MDRHAGALARRVEAGEGGAAPRVGAHAAHAVVLARLDRQRLRGEVDASVEERQLADLRQAVADRRRAEVPQVEQDVAVAAIAEAATSPDLRLDRARDDVAWRQLHPGRGVAR